jgi:UMF1 family MFS transporter
MTHPALLPGVRLRDVFAWAMFDFANSGYTTVVLTAVFATYFVGVVAGHAAWATLMWTGVLSLSYLLTLLVMPAIGAWCDQHARKKRALVWSTLACVVGTAALGSAGPGDWAWAAVWLVVSNVAYSVGESLIAAFLPELARPDAMGKVSGWGWAWGYVGGMLTLAVCLAWVMHRMGQGAPAAEAVPPTMWITALVFALASAVTFWLLPERAQPQAQATPASRALQTSWHELQQALCWARTRPPLFKLLQCIVCYQAGVSVAIAVSAIYAEGEMGMQTQDTMALIFLLNIAALIGAWGLGWLQDHLGHVRTLRWTLIGWIAACWLAAWSPTVTYFWGAAVLAGLCMGASQSIGRAMIGRLTPPERTAQVFALWSVAVRLAAILGPMLYGLLTFLSDGRQRWAIGSTGLLFVLSIWMLSRVHWDAAEQQAALDRSA